MQLGMIGLGRMGMNMALRLSKGGHACVVHDVDRAKVEQMIGQGFTGAFDLDDLLKKLAPPRAVWVMVPAGQPTEAVVEQLASRLGRGDLIVDGGNSFHPDDVRRADSLAKRGILYLDVGTSGGIWGAERGYCLMVGGPKEGFDRLEPVLKTLAPGTGDVPPSPGRPPGTADQGYLHCGPSGAGHFVKMIHNGIEYGLMEAYAEGFDLLRSAGSPKLPPGRRYDLDLGAIAELWRRGSVVGSWLLDLIAQALAESPSLSGFTGVVPDSGEGRWTIAAAMEEEVPTPVLSAALFARFRSRVEHSFGEKLLSAMRWRFGGHVEPK